MDIDREELSRIREVLKANPRGMNVIEIAKAINMHRQSVAKYLEMLVISGHVDVKNFGPAKVYYISRRLPISAMLSLFSDIILILDKDLRIVNVNDRFLDLTQANREDVLYKTLDVVSFPFVFEPSILPIVTEALNGKESTVDATLKKRGDERFYNIKFIPLVFDDGKQGVTILMEDITDRKLIEEERERLTGQLKESNAQLSMIAYVMESATSTLDLAVLLRSMLERLTNAMKADFGAILLKDGGRVHVEASTGGEEADLNRFSIPIGKGFSGRIAEQGKPLYVADAQSDPQVLNPTIKKMALHPMLGVPIRHQGEVIGVLHVGWIRDHPFKKQEQDVLQIIADRCGAAIVNAELYEKLKASAR